jgi:type VI secretion system secreted protein VgrG
MKAKKIGIRVAGAVNLLGGGGIINLTPGSAAFVGMVTLDASGKIKISGNPNLIG